MAYAKADVEVVVCIGDLHAGSALAPCPAHIDLPDEIRASVGRTQTWLRKCWEHFCTEYVPSVVKGRRYALVCNGDLIEGVHHGGSQLVARSEQKHVNIACELLNDLARNASHVYLVAGTECHTRDHEEAIGEKLGAERCKSSGRFAPDWLDIDVRGVLTSFRHHISTTSRRALAATALSIQLVEEQTNAAGSQTRIPRVVVRSHRHKPGWYTDCDGAALVLPAWQLLTRYGHKVVPAEQRSLKVGGAVLDYAGVRDKFDLPTCSLKVYRPTP